MRKFLTGVAAGTLLATLSMFAQAGEIGYSYADLGYVVTDVDGINKDLDGFLLRGSLEVADNWFLYARYVDQSVSQSGLDFDIAQFGLGGGYAWPVAENMDLYGKLGYARAEADVSGGGFGGGDSIDDDGYELGVGLRFMPADAFELEGAVNYVDFSDGGDDTSFGIAGRWYFTDQFALGLEAEFADDSDSYGFGVRWKFAP